MAEKFIIIVDGEVASVFQPNPKDGPGYDKIVAIFKSDPKIIHVTDSISNRDLISEGWRYVNGEFLPPM